MYELETDKWTLITDDTSAMGGPCLLFDHHVAVDVDQQTLYVFGGRQITRYMASSCLFIMCMVLSSFVNCILSVE